MMGPMTLARLPMRRCVLGLGLVALVACDDGSKARIDALEGRIAELERRTTDTAKAIEPLAAIPNTLEQQQQSAKSIREEQATLVARLARAEEATAALGAQLKELQAAGVTAAKGTTPPTTLGTEATTVLPKSLEIGVPACDDYLRKYLACVASMPETARKPMMDAIETTADAWRDAAAGPARDAMAQACEAASEAAGKAFASMGCKW